MVANLTAPGIAAIQWQNNGLLHIRVYFQKDDGFVYEAAWDQGSGWNSGNTQLFQAKIGTPLSAIVFAPTQPQIRVYYLDNNFVLQEYVYSSGWSKGATLPSTDLTPITSLAAVTWTESSQQIRVYYQKTNNTVQEVVYSSSWTLGHSFTDQAFPGTGLSAALISDSPSFRVYWQAEKTLHLNEYNWSGNWANRDLNFSPAPSSGIAAVAWSQGSSAHIRVYVENAAGKVQEVNYNDAGGWVIPPGTPTDIVASYKAPVAAITWIDGGSVQLRVYVQTATDNKLTELVYSNGWSSHLLGF